MSDIKLNSSFLTVALECKNKIYNTQNETEMKSNNNKIHCK